MDEVKMNSDNYATILFILIMFALVGGLVGGFHLFMYGITGGFDPQEVKDERDRVKQLSYDRFDERKEYMREHIKNGTLTCDIISAEMIEDTRTKLDITASLETPLRLFWNASHCGHEWNWYD